MERIPQLQFQRPAPEVELAYEDAPTREIAAGETVRVSSNGTSQRAAGAHQPQAPARASCAIADEHAAGLADRVQVEKVGA